MKLYALKGSMRGKADLCRAIHAEIFSLSPALPDFCPSCDFTHARKLWFRRGAKMLCHNCGYALQKKDYWLSEIEIEQI